MQRVFIIVNLFIANGKIAISKYLELKNFGKNGTYWSAT